MTSCPASWRRMTRNHELRCRRFCFVLRFPPLHGQHPTQLLAVLYLRLQLLDPQFAYNLFDLRRYMITAVSDGFPDSCTSDRSAKPFLDVQMFWGCCARGAGGGIPGAPAQQRMADPSRAGPVQLFWTRLSEVCCCANQGSLWCFLGLHSVTGRHFAATSAGTLHIVTHTRRSRPVHCNLLCGNREGLKCFVAPSPHVA
jgi:hypothetical protein